MKASAGFRLSILPKALSSDGILGSFHFTGDKTLNIRCPGSPSYGGMRGKASKLDYLTLESILLATKTAEALSDSSYSGIPRILKQ